MFAQKTYKRLLIFFFFAVSLTVFAGNDLTSALKALDAGNKTRAREILKQMQRKQPDAPQTLLLDALLNENAEEAKAVYEFIYEEYPDFEYADLCLFRLYSYNYAIGNYITAASYLDKLKKEFPDSPYAKAADNLPKPNRKKTVVKKRGTATKSKFTVQVGAFSQSENARKLSDKLKAKGYSVSLASKVVGSSIFHIVTVGEFNNRERAENLSRKIADEFRLNPKVIELKR